MQLEFYVLNYNINAKKVENFNIFRNSRVNRETIKAVKKYLRAPRKYEYKDWTKKTSIFGFDGLKEEIRHIIMCEEWARCEYEISVGDAFESDPSKLEKWDCYRQAVANIDIITRDVIAQYKMKLKEENDA